MRKTVYRSQPVEIIRECAYCDRECEYEGTAYAEWGLIDLWRCPVHGNFEEVDAPMHARGDQIR